MATWASKSNIVLPVVNGSAWVEPVDLHEDIPGAGAMLLEECTPLLLKVLVTTSWDYAHHAVSMRDRGLQLRQAAERRPVHLAIPS
jgi:hypothetical protein